MVPNRPNDPNFRWEDVFNYSDTSTKTNKLIPATSSVFILPKGSLLFSYDNLFGGKNEATFRNLSDADKNAIMIQQMTRLSMADGFSWNETSKRYEVQSGRTMATLKYFYPTPYSGLGVQGVNVLFNCCWVVMTTCDISIAETISSVSCDAVALDPMAYDNYFTNGTLPTIYKSDKASLKDPNIQHRRNTPLQFPQKTYQDFKFYNCDKIPPNLTVRPGKPYDSCLQHDYSETMLVSGLKTIAGPDSIISFNNMLLKPIFNVNNLSENINNTNLNTTFSAFIATKQANIALKNTPFNNVIINLSDWSVLNTSFFLSDRFYYTNDANPTKIAYLNYSLPEYAINPFGFNQLDNRIMWNKDGLQDIDNISEIYSFPYDQWGIYLKGGLRNEWIKDNTKIPRDTPFEGVFKNCKLVPVGLLLASNESNAYSFINFRNLLYDYNSMVNDITIRLQPNASQGLSIPTYVQHPNVQNEILLNQPRIRSFYISSLMYFDSFYTNTLAYNTLKKLFYTTLKPKDFPVGFRKTVHFYKWNTTANTVVPFDSPLLHFTSILYNDSNIFGFVKTCFVKDLIQTYLAVKYRHLKYNKGIFLLNDNFYTLFFKFSENLLPFFNVGNIYENLTISSSNISDFFVCLNSDIFDDTLENFDKEDRYFPNVNFTPLFPLPETYDENNVTIDTINNKSDTLISYFYRRLYIMMWLDKNDIFQWNSCTKITFIFMLLVYVSEYSKIPFIDFQHEVLVPAGFNILYNDVDKNNNTHMNVYANDDIFDKLLSKWNISGQKQFKSICDTTQAVSGGKKSNKSKSTKRKSNKSKSNKRKSNKSNKSKSNKSNKRKSNKKKKQ